MEYYVSLTTSISVGKKVTIYHGPFVWMSPCLRGVEKFCSNGMPHVTKIHVARKPKGVGAELKDAAESETNIIIRLELPEWAERMAAKKFTDICHSKGTVQTLRLTKPSHHSGRAANGDSAFASVQTAVELKRHGMFFQRHGKNRTFWISKNIP